MSFIASRNLPYIAARGGHFFYKDYRKLVGVRVKMRTRDTMAKGEGYITQKEEEILDKKERVEILEYLRNGATFERGKYDTKNDKKEDAILDAILEEDYLLSDLKTNN